MSAGLSRQRLLATLDALRTSRLGLIVAPAGSGKTTLMAEWARRVPLDVAWHRVDAVDAASDGLVRSLGAVLVPAAPPVDDVDALAAAVERRGRPVLLVLDDFHVLSGTPAEWAFERLLLVAPAGLHVLIGSRRLPSFNLARTELPAPLVVNGDALRFRSWEVERLFREVYNAPLRPDDAAALARRTEGWAAGLHLFHLSTAGRAPAERRRAVDALSGRSRYAQDYLSGQVLAGLPESLRVFLRRTCVFDVLTADRCDELLQIETSQRHLAELERRQALTTSDDDGISFRYHTVLRRHLETALYEELGGSGARHWYARAGRILEDDDAPVEALRAYAHAEDWDSARRVLHAGGQRLLDLSAGSWADLLPRWLTDEDPWVALAEARYLLDDGQLAAAERAARRAEQQFTDPVGRDLCRALVRVTSTWQGAAPRPPVHWDDVLRAAVRRSPAALVQQAVALEEPMGALVTGLVLVLAGDTAGGERALTSASESTADDGRVAMFARLSLVALRAPSAAWDTADAVGADAERLGLSWLARLARAVGRAGSDESREIVDDCDRRGDAWGAVVVTAVRALAALRAGRPDVAALEDLVARSRALDAGVLEAWARAGLALASAAGDLPEALVEARAAESLARSAGAPGALAVAYAALSLLRPGAQDELDELADATARTSGMRCRPWTWVAPDASDARAVQDPARVPPQQREGTRRTPSPAAVHLRCFGAFSLSIDDLTLDLSRVRPRARAVLHLLALSAGRPVHRELLVDALWRDLDAIAGTHNLHVAVSSLRVLLEPGVHRGASRLIVRDGDSYALALPSGSTCDLVDFDAAAAEGGRHRRAGRLDAAATAFRRAVDLYRGDVLPEAGPAEWVLRPRETYRGLAAEVAGTLAELELARGNTGASAAAALRSLAVDSCRDASWRILQDAYLAAGDVAAADRARRSYAEMLESLGLPTDG